MARRLLIIEDDPSIQKVAQLALERLAGWEVLLASSGQEGLDKARAEQPDGVLMDVAMPGMDGLTTLGKLREDAATAGIPVILLTARTQGQQLREYDELALAGVIAKPFDPMGLAKQISAAFGWS